MRLALSLLIVSSAATAAQGAGGNTTTPSSELSPRASLIGIIKGMQAAIDGTVPDPRSMSDVILCPAAGVKYSDAKGLPDKWHVDFSMNSRTSAGGYGGRVMYRAVFRRGRLPEIIRVQAKTDEGFDRLINQATAKKMKDCPIVPNEQLAELLGSSDRPVVDVSH